MSRIFVYCFIFMFASFANAQDRIEKFVSKAKNQATKNLLDPSSAQFRNLEVREMIGDKGKKHLNLCGEVNAKNRMGGYVGFKTFSAGVDSAKILEEDEPSFVMMFHQFQCGSDTKLIRKVQ